jgi:hypothetical protein
MPFSPLFVLVDDGQIQQGYQGCQEFQFDTGCENSLTHVLFLDDVLIFYYCKEREARALKNSLDLLCATIGMVINLNKSTIYFP